MPYTIPTELDWLPAVRVHPLNEALSNTAIAAPLILQDLQRYLAKMQ